MAPHYDLFCIQFQNQTDLCDALTWTKRSVAILSFICSAGVIFFIWLFRKYLCFAQRLILCLAISSMAETIQSMLEQADNMVSCRLRGYFGNSLGWLSLLLIMAITLYLFLLVQKNMDTARFEWMYHTVCWSFPFLFSLLPFIRNKYGPAGIWWWYGPLFVFMFVMVIMYGYLVIKHLHNARISHSWTPEIQEEWDMHNQNIRLIVIYPFIFICIRIFAVTYRIQNAIEPEHPVFALLLLTCITGPLQGTLNAIAFSCDRSTKHDFTVSKIKLAWYSHWNRTVTAVYPRDDVDVAAVYPRDDVEVIAVYPRDDVEEGRTNEQKELSTDNEAPDNNIVPDVAMVATKYDDSTDTSKETDGTGANGYVGSVDTDEFVSITPVTSIVTSERDNPPEPLPRKRYRRNKSSDTNIERSEQETPGFKLETPDDTRVEISCASGDTLSDSDDVTGISVETPDDTRVEISCVSGDTLSDSDDVTGISVETPDDTRVEISCASGDTLSDSDDVTGIYVSIRSDTQDAPSHNCSDVSIGDQNPAYIEDDWEMVEVPL